jgi:uncharacterized membrane protein
MALTLDDVRKWRRRAEREARERLTWNRVYRATSYARSALWIVPLFAMLVVIVTVPILRALDDAIGLRLTGLHVQGAASLYQTVITLTLSFLVFTFGSLLVAIQIAGGQLTPRIIATTLLRDNVVRFTVGLFVFALIFSVMALDRLENRVHELVALIVIILGITSMAAFLFLIDYAARLLRPVSILALVSKEGLEVIETVYPERLTTDQDADDDATFSSDEPRRVVTHVGSSAILLAANIHALMIEARRTRGVIELVPHVGDFVAGDEPLFVLYGGAMALVDTRLRDAVVMGSERTMEQDPLFAFRILVDIALKALSPAINDPTTAVLALDQIHRLLRSVGRRRLRGEIIADGLGKPRVIYHTPDWENYVHVSCNEIRACGASNVQVARRLRAMLENLLATLPKHRHRALEEERASLNEALRSHYPIAADLALAMVPDSQGLGGSTGTRVRA